MTGNKNLEQIDSSHNGGVPQALASGLAPFNLFGSGLKLGVSSTVAKFACVMQLHRLVKTNASCEELQEDFYKLGEWAIMWQMKFSVANCKVKYV